MNSKVLRTLICAAFFTLQIRSVIAESWSIKSPLKSPRHSHTSTALSNGQVLIAGGVSTQDGITKTTEIYDPSTGVSTLTGSMSTGRWDHAAVLLQSGQVLVTGGSSTNDPLS